MDSKTASLVLRSSPVKGVFFNEAASNKFVRGRSDPMKFAAQVTCTFAIVRRAGCVPGGGGLCGASSLPHRSPSGRCRRCCVDGVRVSERIRGVSVPEHYRNELLHLR